MWRKRMSPSRGVSDLAWFTWTRPCLVFQRNHLYVSYPAQTQTYGKRLNFKALLETCTRVGQPIGHTFGISPHLSPPMAAQSAGPSWLPLWGSPNVAMAYVHDCREWRVLLHHVAPHTSPQIRVQIDTCCGKAKQPTSETQIYPPKVTRTHKTRGGGESWRWGARPIKGGSRVPPRGQWIFTFLSREMVWYKNTVTLRAL